MNTLFLDRMLVLLAQGSFTATYKYALMLALIDLCVEGTAEGTAPTIVTTVQVAERLIMLYWPHTRLYHRWATPDAESDAGRLYQSSTAHLGRGRAQAGILQRIVQFRAGLVRACHTPGQASRLDPDGFRRMRDEIEWIAATQPIPRLQLIGKRYEPFLYHLGWTVEQNSGLRIQPELPPLTRRSQLRPDGLDNRLRFLPGVPDQLVSLAAVLRPLIQRQWSDMVARLNGLPERHLEEFLFGQERIDLTPVREPLLDLQAGRCFYCLDRVQPGEAHVDHFLPWSRVPLDDLGNLVVADQRCNLSKRDFLVGGELLTRWIERAPAPLKAIADATAWDHQPDRPLAAASVIYRHLSPGVPLWRGREEFRDLEPAELSGIFAALQRRPAIRPGGGMSPD